MSQSYPVIRESIRRPWIGLHMDGRNEHGTHFLPVPPDGICLSEKMTEDLLDSHSDDVERVFADAEKLGYIAGCAIVVFCTAINEEFGTYFELSNISECLTQLIYGDAQEQMAHINAMCSA